MGSQEQKNLLLAIVLSVAILFAFQLMQPPPEPLPDTAQPQTTAPGAPAVPGAGAPGAPTAAAPSGVPVDGGIQDRATVLERTPRVAIETPALSGSISLEGGRIDDLVLKNYRETLEDNSPLIELLHPLGTADAYYADFGWSAGAAGVAVPDSKTLWEATGARLEPGQPLTLSWDNGQGLRFERLYEVDENYLFTVTQRVVNTGEATATLSPYGLVSRRGTPQVQGFFILHEGFTGAFNGELEEFTYDDLSDDAVRGQAEETFETTGGWLGITDKYWMVALIPDQDSAVEARYHFDNLSGTERYQADYLSTAMTVPAGGEVQITSRLFAGAKVVGIIEDYQAAFEIPLFDRSVDFGWFYFLTKPLFHLLEYFYHLLGNFGLAILALTVLIKLAFFPLANKSYRAMAKMRNLQPEMVKLRERFSEDRQRLNQEMMELYKREKVNPMAGCLPVLIQIPVFFALYKVLFVTIEMRHAPFYGWIEDLSAQDPTSILNGFGLLPWGIPDLGFFAFFSIGIWPLLMGLTMFLQTKLNPQPADPLQAKIFLWMPIFFMFLLAPFPAGLVIYWTWNNVLSVIQQYVIMKRAGAQIGGKAPPLVIPGLMPDSGAAAKGEDAAKDGEDGGQEKDREEDSGDGADKRQGESRDESRDKGESQDRDEAVKADQASAQKTQTAAKKTRSAQKKRRGKRGGAARDSRGDSKGGTGRDAGQSG